jgi:hypothetical protein
MSTRARTVIVLAALGVATAIGFAPAAHADEVPEINVPSSGGRGACVAVHDVGGWCLVNPL